MNVSGTTAPGPGRRRDTATERNRPADRLSASETLDARLLRAWLSGDRVALDAEWSLLWSSLFPMAIAFCRRMGRDETTAEQWASAAIEDAWREIDQKLARGERPRPGEGELVNWITARTIVRCRDQRRAFASWAKRFFSVSEGEDEPEDRLGALASVAASQDNLIEGDPDREGLRRIVCRVAMLRELCGRRDALIAVVDRMEDYLRDALAQALPSGVDAAAMTTDQLVEAVEPESVTAAKSTMYQAIMSGLGISRNTLDQRMKHVHKLLKVEE